MQIRRNRAAGVLTGTALVLAGCQHYQPRPLTPGDHVSDWLARTPANEEVVDFARRLNDGSESGATFDPTDGISLAEAEVVALVFNPDLRLARLRVGLATAAADHAADWDDPEFEFDVLRATESVPDPWVITSGLAITIPISGRIEAERARADAAVRAEITRVADAEWRVCYDVRRAWLAWSATLLQAEETKKLLGAAELLAESTARVADAGEMPRTEASLFVIEHMQRRQESRRLEAEVAQQQLIIRQMLGLSPDAPLVLVPEFDDGTLDDDPQEPVESLTSRNLTLRRLRDEYQVAEHALRREVRKQYPDLTVGPLFEDDQGQSSIGFLGGLPIPMLNANKRGIAEARAQRELARAEFETELERTIGALTAARLRAQSLAAQRDEAGTVIAPLVDRQLADARRLLELGEGGGLVLLESLVRAHEAKLKLVELRRDEALARAEAAFLAGPPIANDNADNVDHGVNP